MLDNDSIKITKINDRIVCVQAKSGIEVTGTMAADTKDIIAAGMKGKYGMIIDRSGDYSVDLVPVYKVLNESERLDAIAIVSHRDMTLVMAKTEKMLFKGAMELFNSISSATDWLNEVLPEV